MFSGVNGGIRYIMRALGAPHHKSLQMLLLEYSISQDTTVDRDGLLHSAGEPSQLITYAKACGDEVARSPCTVLSA
jgi:hypothetical protein